MAITEESRFHLHQRLTDVLGEEHATTLMEHLPPVGWADVATKRDLDQAVALMKKDLDQAVALMKKDLEVLRSELKGDIEALRTELKADIEALRTELKGDMELLRTELKGDMELLRTELKGDMEVLRTEFKGDIEVLRTEIRELPTRRELEELGRGLDRQMTRMTWYVIAAITATATALSMVGTLAQ